MKRFYKTVVWVGREDGYDIELDGRQVRTPRKAVLRAPTKALADAVVKEWDEQGDEISLSEMPMTKLANTAIDRVMPMRRDVIANVAGYGGSDLVCYLAEEPEELVARQDRHWRPLRNWLHDSRGVALTPTTGILHVSQAPEALERLAELVAAYDDLGLTAVHEFTTITGSLVIALALADAAIDLGSAWSAAQVDEAFQAELWGEDEEAEARRQLLFAEFSEAWRFFQLSRASCTART